MKNSFLKTTFLLIALLTMNINLTNAQSTESSFEIRILDINSLEYFRGNAHIVINHEEQWDHFKDFRATVKKNKNLKLVITKQLPTGMFKPNISFKEVSIRQNGKSLKLKDVRVDKSASKGKEKHIYLKYKSVD